MSKKDFEGNLGHGERKPLVTRFEKMMKSNSNEFFDHRSLEKILEYYEEHLDFKTALKAVEIALTQYPFSGTFLMKKGEYLYENKMPSEAIEYLTKAQIHDPADMRIYFILSDVYIELEQYENALRALEKAEDLAANVELVDVYLEFADLYEEWSNIDMVIKYLKKALVREPRHFEAQSRFQFVTEIHEKDDVAIKFLNKLIDKDPYSKHSWYNLANAYYNIDLFEKAIEGYEYAIAIDDKFEMAYRDCGETLYKIEFFDKAIELLQESIKINPSSDESFYFLGMCFYKQDLYNKAINYFKKAISIDEFYSEAWHGLSLTYLSMKRYQSAMDAIQKALDTDINSFEYNLHAAKICFEQSKDETATFYINRIKNYDPHEQLIWNEISKVLFQTEKTQEAIDTLIGLGDKVGHKAERSYLLAVYHFDLGMKNNAMNYLAEALDLNYEKHKLIFDLLPYLRENREVNDLIDLYK